MHQRFGNYLSRTVILDYMHVITVIIIIPTVHTCCISIEHVSSIMILFPGIKMSSLIIMMECFAMVHIMYDTIVINVRGSCIYI